MVHVLPARMLSGWLIFIALLCFSVSSQSADSLTVDRPLVIGAISYKARKHIEHAQPLADYLAGNLGHYGYTHGKVVVVQSVEEMAELLRSGQVDLLSETVFSALMLEEQAGAEMLLRRWKKGVGIYSSLIFTRQGRSIDSLDDLKGKVIAFEDRESTSSYFIPAALLLKQGYELTELDSLDQTVPKDKIGYVFAKDILKTANEISVSSWVYRGVVDAGALSSANWNDDQDLPEQFRPALSVIYQSVPFPRSILLVRPAMDESLKAAIKGLLVAAEFDEAGQFALEKYQQTRRFDELNRNSSLALQLASRLLDISRAQLVSRD